MRALRFHPPAINPIFRDLILVVTAALLVSIVFVTAGYLVLAQVLGE
ncbi:MAG: hypothetical protein JNK10_00880 [Cyclobacteriaceae bacterium]|nr:hypothetical protein [Cyclobacteriaceae bacterium]